MYELREIHEGEGESKRLVGVDIMCGPTRCAGFQGGLSMMITTINANFGSYHDRRQAFLHGIVLTMSHCAITGSIPTVVDR